jgi:phytoene dehydrogenase-like protein
VTAPALTTSVAYDAIVIGAGLNGLVAAAYLAKAGQRVLVLERRGVIGGTVATEEVVPGFRFDTCRHDAGWLSPHIVSDLKLKRHGLEMLDVDASVFAPHPSGDRNDYLLLHHDPQRSAALIRKHSASDADKWPKFADRIARLAGFLKAAYARAAPDVDAASFGDLMSLAKLGTRLRVLLGKTEMVELLRTVPMSVGELLDDWFETDVLKGVVGARGVTGILQGPRSGGTAFVLLHHQVGRPVGAFRAPAAVQGGVGSVARALAAAATAFGAEIRTGTDVARVRTQGDRAAGVVLRNGDEIAAHRVVSGADPRRTFLDLCDPTRLEPGFVRAVRNLRYRGAWAKVNLALSALPTFSALRGNGAETSLRGTISISPSLAYLEHAYDDAKYGRVSERPHLEIRIPSLADPSLAPPGRHVMSIEVQYAPYHLRDGEWDDRARDALGDRVVEALASYAPDLPNAIVHRQVLTPRDLENDFALTEGHVYHGELTLDQILFMRPVAGWSRYRTPVRDLYLCGAGTHPGGGIAGGSGANAVREILRDGKQHKGQVPRSKFQDPSSQ